jgi:hypothetical protein
MNVGPPRSICSTRNEYHHLVVPRSPSLLALPLRLSLDPSNASKKRMGAVMITGRNSSARRTNLLAVESGSITQSRTRETMDQNRVGGPSSSAPSGIKNSFSLGFSTISVMLSSPVASLPESRRSVELPRSRTGSRAHRSAAVVVCGRKGCESRA